MTRSSSFRLGRAFHRCNPNHQGNVIRPGILVTVVLVSLAACASNPVSAPTDGEPPHFDFDRTENVVTHQGWSIAAPPEWRFYYRIGAEDSGELFRGSGDAATISCHKITFDLAVDEKKLFDFVERELEQDGKIVSSGALEPPLAAGSRGTAQRWTVRRDDEITTVVLEHDGTGWNEWRIETRETTPETVHLAAWTIFREATRATRNVSHRRTPSGFAFTSLGTAWRWTSDIADGFIVERLNQPGENRYVVALFSRESLEDGDSWLDTVTAESAPLEPRLLFVAGTPVDYSAVAGPVRRSDLRIVIDVPESELFQPFTLLIYIDNRSSEPIDAVGVLEDPTITALLDLCIEIPQVEDR